MHDAGTIPAGLVHLKNLKTLNIGKNSFSAPLPCLPNSLEILNLYDNRGKFTGGIPPEWGSSLTNLRTLNLHNSGLDGARSVVGTP